MTEQFKKGLQEKRATFFHRLSNMKNTREKEGQDAMNTEEAASNREQTPETGEGAAQEKEAYLIRCPKCGKMVETKIYLL